MAGRGAGQGKAGQGRAGRRQGRAQLTDAVRFFSFRPPAFPRAGRACKAGQGMAGREAGQGKAGQGRAGQGREAGQLGFFPSMPSFPAQGTAGRRHSAGKQSF